VTIVPGDPAQDMNELLIRLLGAFSHVQLLIDQVLAKNFFEKRVPKAADFLLKRVVSRIRDEERTKLVQAIAAEVDAPTELDNFNQVYMDVKRLRDRVAHAARVQSHADGVLQITKSYIATGPTGNLDVVTVERSEIEEAVRMCRWLEAQIFFILDSTDLTIKIAQGAQQVAIAKPSKAYQDWDGVTVKGIVDEGRSGT
jgi:hypothetical protein